MNWDWNWNWQDRTGEAEVCKPKISGAGASEGPGGNKIELFAADVDVGDESKSE